MDKPRSRTRPANDVLRGLAGVREGRTLPGMKKQREKPEWVRVAEEYEVSGLTQREFAEGRSMKLSTLQSWVYRRRRQQREAPAVPVRLLPVQVTEAPVVSRSESLEVLLGSGERVRFEVGTDVQYVARVVAALERKSC